MCVYIVNSS